MRFNGRASLARRVASASARSYRNNLGFALYCAAVVLVLGDATLALAVSGETEDAQGVYEIPQAQCDALTAASDMPTGFKGDVLFTCDADRQGCRLSFDELDEGLALGFCENKFDLTPYRYEGPIEANAVIQATSFGNDIGVLRPPSEVDPDSIGVDILCETFVRLGVPSKRCRKIIEGGIDGPACDGFIKTKQNNCVAIRNLLAGTVTGDPAPNISFALFIDVDNAGRQGSEALLVCPGFRWECANPADLAEDDITVQYQFIKFIIDTPGCIRVGGTCYRYRP
jgi:hypothetical protein